MQEIFDCITKSNKSNEHAFCTVCSVDISVAHGGRQDITTAPYSSLIIYAVSLILQLSGWHHCVYYV